jgi:hypothetical protein
MQQYLPKAKKTSYRIEGKVTHVWQFLKFKSVATTVPATLLNHIENSEDSEALSEAAVTVVTTSREERTCGSCGSWHRPSCSYPDGNPSCVVPTNKYAADCRNYQERSVSASKLDAALGLDASRPSNEADSQ